MKVSAENRHLRQAEKRCVQLMTDLKQTLIDKAQVRFLNGDVAEFSAILKDLYDSHITSNCFLETNQKHYGNHY